jgi:hypothetical protein
MFAFIPTALRFVAEHLKAALMVACALALAGYIVTLHLEIDAARAGEAQAKQVVDKINAASAKDLADALANQQAAEGKVAAIEKSFNDEVSKHAQDSLDYRARLAAGVDRMRVRVADCSPAVADQSPASPGRSYGAAAYGYLDGQVASSVFKVVADDQAEIDKLTALQAYVRAMQAQGYIEK